MGSQSAGPDLIYFYCMANTDSSTPLGPVPISYIEFTKQDVQGDPSVWLKSHVSTVLLADGPLLHLPAAQAGLRNILNPSQWVVSNDQMGHHVLGWSIKRGQRLPSNIGLFLRKL